MKFSIISIFPEMFEILKTSILGRAIKNELIEIEQIDLREFSVGKHKKVDDTPYGGGAGMVMRPDVIYEAIKSVRTKQTKVIYLSPKGKKLNQEKVVELSKEKHIILICGRYEGIDERVIEEAVDEEISIGDYVLTGGELPAMVLIDAVSRNVKGVLSEDSINDSFYNNLLEYPQYTKPEVFLGRKVPEVLKSGNHQEIAKWRKQKSLEITMEKRPDLIKKCKEGGNDGRN